MYVNKCAISALILILTLISSHSIQAKTLNAAIDQTSIVGIWQLNRAASGKVLKQPSASMLSMPVAFAPESLILAADEGVAEITINEGFKEFIHTQTLPTDGTAITKHVQSIGQVSAKAFWKNKKLIVEVTNTRGDKMTEIFELSANQKRLNVTLQINEFSSTTTTTIKRVYNRMVETSDDKTAAIGIMEFPFL